MVNVVRRPHTSPSLPPMSMNDAMTSEYRTSADWTPETVVSRLLTTDVTATFIAVVS